MNKKTKVYVIFDDEGDIMAVISDEDSAIKDCREIGANYCEKTLYIGDPQTFIESFKANN